MVGAISSSFAGIASASDRFAASAERIAQAGTGLSGGSDVTGQVVAQLEAKNSLSLNTAVLKLSLDAEKQVLDILV